MSQQVRTLVVEDDQDIANLLSMQLGEIGCVVECCDDGLEAVKRATSDSFELIILDVTLPGLDGFGVCREVRAHNRYVPILMLTAKSAELDRVLGLELGADDYLTKPFSLMELSARVKALLRRSQMPKAEPGSEELLKHGPLQIDTSRRRVQVDGKAIELTTKEFDLLLHFASQPGRVFTRMELLDKVWGYSHECYEHTVNSHINRLRSKIENDPQKPRFIITNWGTGYHFAEVSEL